MYKVTLTENQKITWLPFNDITKTIFYDTRTAISQERDIPVCWSCSKVEDMNVKGIARYTWKQDKWDEIHDYVEKDENGNFKGYWCNYFDGNITPDNPDPLPTTIHCEVTYSGSSTDIRIKGSYKKFTVTFYDVDEIIPFQSGTWMFTVDGEDVSSVMDIQTTAENTSLSENQVRVKFIGDDSYIGKVLEVKFESSSGVRDSVLMNILGL